MTVSELIDLLRDCDPNANVVDHHGNDIDEIDNESEEGVVYLES